MFRWLFELFGSDKSSSIISSLTDSNIMIILLDEDDWLSSSVIKRRVSSPPLFYPITSLTSYTLLEPRLKGILIPVRWLLESNTGSNSFSIMKGNG